MNPKLTLLVAVLVAAAIAGAVGVGLLEGGNELTPDPVREQPRAVEAAADLVAIPETAEATETADSGQTELASIPAGREARREEAKPAVPAPKASFPLVFQAGDQLWQTPQLQLATQLSARSVIVSVSNGEVLRFSSGGQFVLIANQTLPDGPHTTYHDDGKVATHGTVRGGKRVGLWTTWHAGGERGSEGRYTYGHKHGAWTTWHPTGEKESSGGYCYDQRDGPWADYYEDGERREVATYVNGQKDGTVVAWHANGTRESRVFYSYGRLHLSNESWHDNGERAARGSYEYGTQVGRWRYWRADGTPDAERSGVYEGGQRVRD